MAFLPSWRIVVLGCDGFEFWNERLPWGGSFFSLRGQGLNSVVFLGNGREEEAQKRRRSGEAAPPRCGGEPGCERGGAARGGQESRCVRAAAAAGSRAGPLRVAAAAAMCAWWGAVLRVLVLQASWALGGGQVRYSVPEEAKVGTVVGRLWQDLGLEAGDAEARRLRLVAQGRRASVEVSEASGALVVSSRLDREELCGKSAPCAVRLEVLVERPLRVFHVELEVTDVNDNAPLFPATRKNLSLSENSPPGSDFPLEGASDADIGANAQLSYTLSPSEHFALDLQKLNQRNVVPDLVLTKALDRETLPVHWLLLTASDGGRPPLTGTLELLISVLDANDNAPQFNQSVYKVQLPESAVKGTLVVRVNATDPDEGINSEVTYTASNFIPVSGRDVITVNPKTGEIRLSGMLDFEEVSIFHFRIEARDKGTPPLLAHCSVELEVLDVNDNAPEVWVTSLSVPVPEDAAVGTVVALLSVSDRDSGANGRVRCAVWPSSPFGLVARFAGSYSLVLREALDRERVSEYAVEVRAEDGGAPPLRASRGLRVPVSDVNDNAPAFAQAVYTVLARENNAAGAELARLWARDPDEAGNGRVSYSLGEGGVGVASVGGGWRSASSYVSVDAESGRLWALQPLDYEEVQVLQFEVRAVDAGEPPLCGNATVQLFVVDENDNEPSLLSGVGGGPVVGSSGAGSSGSEALWAWAAWGAPAGQVVAKIRAVDADSGYNAWLRYELLEPRGKGAFRVGLYSGEVSTARALEEADGPRQRLVIVVRDHGEPARSATATLSVSLVEGTEAALAAAGSSASSSSGSGSGLRPAAGAEGGSASAASATNVWLVVAICAVSSLFVLAVVLYGASRWAPRAAVLSGPGPATLVCASEVGSWSYSQRQSRSLCVADGAGKSDLMVFSPNLPPPPGAAAKETQPEAPAVLDTVSGRPFLASGPFPRRPLVLVALVPRPCVLLLYLVAQSVQGEEQDSRFWTCVPGQRSSVKYTGLFWVALGSGKTPVREPEILGRTMAHVFRSLELEAFLILRQSHGIEMPAISFEVAKISHQRQSFWWACIAASTAIGVALMEKSDQILCFFLYLSAESVQGEECDPRMWICILVHRKHEINAIAISNCPDISCSRKSIAPSSATFPCEIAEALPDMESQQQRDGNSVFLPKVHSQGLELEAFVILR
ncbi:protocadherin alpha-2-like [Opisthocomus hoazin]|uniref:protocadherin alpha-2-like n=1 Tax=Opisthocomus hoazin TaxID=30419 RepID=UPI003F529F4A